MISILASTKAVTSAGGTITFDSTGCNSIILFTGFGGSPTVSDNKGNTYSQGSPNSRACFWHVENANTGTGHIITIGGGSTASSWVVLGASGVKLTGAYSSPGGTSLGTVTSAAFGVAVNPPEDNCLLLMGMATSASAITGVTGANGWSIPQWNSGEPGVNYGSILAYKIQTTATTIPGTETYATWTTGVDGEQIAAIFKAEPAPAGSITITSPTAYDTNQRSGTTGSIQITGTYTGTPVAIEASFNGGAYTTIVASPSGGTFSGTLTGQPQGQGTLSVRFTDTTSINASVTPVAIGDVFVVIGDSNAEGRADFAQTYTNATLNATKFRQDNLWGNGNDPMDTGTSVGSHWPLLATMLMADIGVPVAFITTAEGGTDVAGSSNTWAKPNAQYTGMQTTVTNSGVTGVKGVLAHLGSNAVVNATTLSLATYNSAIDTLASNLGTDLPGAPKLHIGIFGETATGAPPDRRAALDNIRGGIMQALSDNANVKPGPCLIDQDYSDGVHFTTNAQEQEVANRWYLALKESLYGGASGRGPRVVSSQWNSSGRNQLTVVFDRALRTGLTHSAVPWRVFDNGTLMTVTGVAYHGSNANALVVSTSAAATGPADTTTMSFASGDDAVGQVVPQSTALTVPGGGSVYLPAEPAYAVAVAEYVAIATTVSLVLTTDGSTPAASLTGLKWAFFDQVNPSTFAVPTAKGTGATTDGTGLLVVSIVGTALPVGSTGWLVVTNSDGTTTQSPMKGFSGPVQVS